MPKKLTQEIIIEKFKKVHGEKYDYSKSIYENSKNKVIIICNNKKHGYFEFYQTPNDHTSKKNKGCPKCSGNYRYKTVEILKELSKIHEFKYDYSKVDYINSKTKIIIICKEHGEFKQTPHSHLHGQGCAYCGNKKNNKNDFIKKSKLIHGDTYNYDSVEYINNKIRINIKCKKHGIFNQLPSNHLAGRGCEKCGIEITRKKRKFDKNGFFEKAKKIHGDKYTYEKTEYLNGKNEIIITCKIHGEFKQLPRNHLLGRGCRKCGKCKPLEYFINNSNIVHNKKYDYSLIKSFTTFKQKVKITCPIHGIFFQQMALHLNGSGCPKCNGGIKLTIDDLLNKFHNIHKNKYDYSLIDYTNSLTKISIICKKHGVFSQTPSNHLNGQNCPKCRIWNGEDGVKLYLDENKIEYISQKTFSDCKSEKGGLLRFDFFLIKSNMCIEYDGQQHFEIVDFFGGEEGFRNRNKNDSIKNNFCKENNINLLRIPYTTKNIKELLNLKIK